MAKRMWTPDHHTHMMAHNWLECLYNISFTWTKEPNVPAWQWLCTSKQAWGGKKNSSPQTTNQRPGPNPSENLWDELERPLHPRPSRPTSASDLTNALWLNEHTSKATHWNLVQKPFHKSGGYYNSKWRPNLWDVKEITRGCDWSTVKVFHSKGFL